MLIDGLFFLDSFDDLDVLDCHWIDLQRILARLTRSAAVEAIARGGRFFASV